MILRFFAIKEPRKRGTADEKTWFDQFKGGFKREYAVFWNTLSRFNNLLVIVNISMLFLTRLVAQGYYYPFFHWPVPQVSPSAPPFPPLLFPGSGITGFILG